MQGAHWRWVAGPTSLRLRNPRAVHRFTTIEFAVGSVIDRTVVIRVGDLERRFVVHPSEKIPVRLPVVLQPGTTIVSFTTDKPPWREPGPGGRPLAFSVHDLSVR